MWLKSAVAELLVLCTLWHRNPFPGAGCCEPTFSDLTTGTEQVGYAETSRCTAPLWRRRDVSTIGYSVPCTRRSARDYHKIVTLGRSHGCRISNHIPAGCCCWRHCCWWGYLVATGTDRKAAKMSVLLTAGRKAMQAKMAKQQQKEKRKR